ncbi:pitrilysin family protein [Speluncibacter jeojiensis]|uniref:Insulinase family protein n=1 Tax=Speluncibacter jeojiensis TaxID=2710754 RepID=A0A9X4M278_9ACTN|nr:insulinase family protein [Corynebacteriales bacterium D3-21]
MTDHDRPRRLPELTAAPVEVPIASATSVSANGLRVVAVRMPTVPMVELRMTVPFAGPDRRHAARADLLSSCLMTGTRSRTRLDLDTDLAVAGAALGAAAGPDFLTFAGSAPAEHLPTLLDLLDDVLEHAAYPVGEFDGERDRLAERLRVFRARPGVRAREALLAKAFGAHPVTFEVPLAKDVAALGVEEVRALHRAAVSPRGSVLTLVGDLDPDTAIDAVGAALAGWTCPRPAAVLERFEPVRPSPLQLVDRPRGVQSQIRLVGNSVARSDPSYPAAKIANLVFGGYFSSRLVENVREDKGYTYGASSLLDSGIAGDMLLVALDTARETTAAAVLETVYELSRMVTTPPTAAEVDAARQYAIGALSISLSSQSGLAGTVAGMQTVGLGLEWLTEHPRALATVTVDEVGAAAAALFGAHRFTGIVQGDAASLTDSLQSVVGVVS